VLLPPINFIFKLLQTHATVQIWLYEQLAIRIEGKIRVYLLFVPLLPPPPLSLSLFCLSVDGPQGGLAD